MKGSLLLHEGGSGRPPPEIFVKICLHLVVILPFSCQYFTKNVLQFLPISAHNQTPPIALSKLTTLKFLLNAMAYTVT